MQTSSDQENPNVAIRSADQDRIENLIGNSILGCQIVRRGYTAAERWRCTTRHGSFFAKIATNKRTKRELNYEYQNYLRIEASFTPDLLGFIDAPERPVLLLEDLCDASWPPPWSRHDIDTVLESITAVHNHQPKPGIKTFMERNPNESSSWSLINDDPKPFLSLGLVDANWLKAKLPALIEAEQYCSVEGNALCHWDLRSDNMCLPDGGMKFVDWGDACFSNPKLDLGAWLPSLAFEGGPLPDDILPNEPEIAAWVCGFFAAYAGLPVPSDAPLVRKVQKEQLSIALPWCQRALKI